MYKCEEVPIIKSAILSGDKEYKGFELPTAQRTGTSTQRDSHASILAEKFYDEKIQATYEKKLIPNDKFIETISQIAEKVVHERFGEAGLVDDGEDGSSYTEEAQDFFNKVYDEIETIFNTNLNVWADN